MYGENKVNQNFEDKTLVCKECKENFIFTAGEQEFYAKKNFNNEPQRCKKCRDAIKAQKSRKGPREMFEATCAECGGKAMVPFKPNGERPVYCSDCFAKRNGETSRGAKFEDSDASAEE